MSMLTIDELRKLNGKAVYHPLGAIRLHVDKLTVWHFYSDQSPMMSDENIHTHPYSFKSTIYKGGIRNIVYHYEQTEENTKCRLLERACKEGACQHDLYDNVNYYEALTFDTFAGESYNIHHSVMHKIEVLTPKAISLLNKKPIEADALFILDKDVTFDDDEFFNQKSEKECWEIIEYTLAE